LAAKAQQLGDRAGKFVWFDHSIQDSSVGWTFRLRDDLA